MKTNNFKKTPYSDVYTPSERYLNMRKKHDEQASRVKANSERRSKYAGYDEQKNSIVDNLLNLFSAIGTRRYAPVNSSIIKQSV